MSIVVSKISGKKYEVVIGLEVHAQLKTQNKLFSFSKTEFGSDPNSQVSLFDIALPGMLPVLNKDVIDLAIKTGLALNAKINKSSRFDRKHYFYPDLPQGYQITQLYEPIIENGFLEIDMQDGSIKKIRINRAHIEQDAGKLTHDLHPRFSCVDLNRSGIPLLEIVSEPDIRSAYEACEYIKELRSILRTAETCDGDMDKGSFRCDVNISLMPEGSKTFGTRVEIKNMNSIRFIEKAIEYEIQRHIEAIESGLKLAQETRLFDAENGVTKSMRSKEDSVDYRYMPDPDLLSLEISDQDIENAKLKLPLMPRKKRDKYSSEFGLPAFEAGLLASSNEISNFFDQMVEIAKDGKMCANWLLVELFARLNKDGIGISDSKVDSRKMAELVLLIKSGKISGKIAKDVLDKMLESGKGAEEIVSSLGLLQISDKASIEKFVDDILLKNQDKVAEYKSGKVKLFGFFVGQAMVASKGSLNPEMLNEVLKSKLD